MTLATIIAAHTARSATPVSGSVATCGAQTVGTAGATHVTPATPEKQTFELRPRNLPDTDQPKALADPLALERARLLALAVAERIDAAHVDRLHDADLVGCLGLNDCQRAIFLHWLADTGERMAGRAPEADTAAMDCQACGLVWIHPDIAAVLPEVDGRPQAWGYPWCFVRKSGGHIPRPPTMCGDCHQLNRDAIDPPPVAGAYTKRGGTAYPTASRYCTSSQPGKDLTA